MDGLRKELVEYGRRLLEKRLVTGTGGNVSVRLPGSDRFLVTPSGMPYQSIEPEDLVEIDAASGSVSGRRRPSIEWELHARVYLRRPDVGAVVHFHGLYTRALAVARQELPVIVDGLALRVGHPVRVAPYAPPGSSRLATCVVEALQEDPCVLMANHGALAVGRNLSEALETAESLEEWAHVYLLARLAGSVVSLTAHEVAWVRDEFARRGYGQEPKNAAAGTE